MNDQPTLDEIHEDDSRPATRQDVREAVEELAEATKRGFDQAVSRDDLGKLEHRLATKFATREDLNTVQENLVRHFDETVEKIRRDLEGVNRNEIGLLEDRLSRLERQTGLPGR